MGEYALPGGEPWHVGRSWVGHRLEDDCPCEQQACGLVIGRPDCPEHGFTFAKTLRQGHAESSCSGHRDVVSS